MYGAQRRSEAREDLELARAQAAWMPSGSESASVETALDAIHEPVHRALPTGSGQPANHPPHRPPGR